MSEDLFSVAEKPAPDTTKTNAPELSVSELAFSLKKTLEDAYGRVRVRGELSRVKIHTSGHMYSDLKDENAVINLICWRGQVAKLSIKPEEGLEVICTGRVSTFPARSNYQLIVESMELAGEGALLKLLEERKKKLAAEGLFDETRKKQLPFLPQTIGVVTSETGAVFHDILHRVRERFPVRVVLWPVPVQGKGADEKITEAIRGFNALENKPDILIVGRGGGSLEDLMAFNEENVVRAIAESSIPVISSVGHETDTTLADYAADRRAPTPTAAAEMAVPERLSLMAQVEDDGLRAFAAIRRTFSDLKNRLEAVSGKLGDPAHLLEIKTQKIDHLQERLSQSLQTSLTRKSSKLAELSAMLRHPKDRIREYDIRLNSLTERLVLRGTKLLEKPSEKLEGYTRLLETLSFKSVLERGFVVVRDGDGKPVTDAKNVKNDHDYNLEYKQNQIVKVRAKR